MPASLYLILFTDVQCFEVQKVSEIIYNASKGSKYFNNEEVKDRNLTEKINRILLKKSQLEGLNLSTDLRRADDYIAQLELSRDLSQKVLHIDCDAFYATVEELERPELKKVPMAVGKGVLTTCNYEARKYGCRSGMAGFVATKLCPDLICLPMNFAKYNAKAKEVRIVLAEYDPSFESAGSDEAYLNITAYCEKANMDPVDVVSQLRREVFERTGLTVSAGLAANAKLAKIVSNKNKPNGQFYLPTDRTTIMNFMKDLPIRKINGIGRVFERELQAVGIDTCGDIYPSRAKLSKLFGEKAFQFLVGCYLGLGRTEVGPAEDSERKSVGTESTFHDISSKSEFREKLRYLSEELEKDLTRTQFKGRTLVLKVKLHTYEVFTRQTVLPKAIYLADDLFKYALPVLRKLEKEFPNMRLRLMGLRLTHLVSMKKPIVNFFGVQPRTTNANSGAQGRNTESSNDGWEIWPEEEFEEAARQEKEAEFQAMEVLSQEYELREANDNLDPKHVKSGSEKPMSENPDEQQWVCPICDKPQNADYQTFNAHVDFCLSKQAIKDAVKSAPEPVNIKKENLSLNDTESLKLKRVRTSSDKLRSTTKKGKIGVTGRNT